uniref:Ig-like domain-containing protein n=1 Tax=Aeromonas caviae TaxID=648 RepID=UPI00191CB336
VGLSEQLKGEAILSDGQVLDVTTDDAVSWHSSNPAVATIISSGPDKGKVTGVSTGTVTITASGEANGQSSSATAEVTITHAVVTRVQITPAVSSLPVGLSEQLKGEAILSDGQVLDVTTDDAVSWHSSNPAVATIISSGPDKGKVTGVSTGTVTITASGEANGQSFSAAAEVTITHAVVTQVQITPAVSSLPVGLSEQLTGEAILSDGQVLDVTADDAVSWRSSNSAVATISSSGPDKGKVTGVSTGTVTITASGEANGQPFSATAEVTITHAAVTQVQITPAVSSLPVGLSEQLKGEALLSDGQVLDVTTDDAVSWRTSDPAVATISSSGPDKGRVTGVSAGTVTITASGEANGQSFSATAEVTITHAVVTRVQITPAVSSLPAGLSEQLKGEAILSDGQVLDVTTDNAVSWRSSNRNVATISSSGPDKGRVTGVSTGTVTITASGEVNGQPFSATAEVEVKALLSFFTTPDTTLRNWNDADAYCRELSPPARLATRHELETLFVQSTSATAIGQKNNDMCEIHGWPMSQGKCGGITNSYWNSTVRDVAGNHWTTNMYDGGQSSSSSGNDNSVSYVTCTRWDL